MVTIRLTRRGGRNAPFYHVVVADSRKRQGGPVLEQVGFFNPIARKQDKKIELDLGRIRPLVVAGRRPLQPPHPRHIAKGQPPFGRFQRWNDLQQRFECALPGFFVCGSFRLDYDRIRAPGLGAVKRVSCLDAAHSGFCAHSQNPVPLRDKQWAFDRMSLLLDLGGRVADDFLREIRFQPFPA